MKYGSLMKMDKYIMKILMELKYMIIMQKLNMEKLMKMKSKVFFSCCYNSIISAPILSNIEASSLGVKVFGSSFIFPIL